MNHALKLALAVLSVALAFEGERSLPFGAGQDSTAVRRRAERALTEALRGESIRLDLERGLVGIPAHVRIREDLLEYLLVGPRGATHESLFATLVRPSLLNGALLALGVEAGLNARWEPVSQAASGVESEEPEHRLLLPEGDGFFLYAAWREGEETYLFRIDDLVANLVTGRSMKRHRWVFLGSRFRVLREGEPEVFVADLEQNLINLSFFYQGNTLITPALEGCRAQTIWVANAWLVPPRDSEVQLIFSRRVLEELPPDWVEELPEAVRAEPEGSDGEVESDGD